MATVTEQLRRALRDSGASRYRVSVETGILESTLSRFAAGASIRSDGFDTLAAYLGLELRPKVTKTTTGMKARGKAR